MSDVTFLNRVIEAKEYEIQKLKFTLAAIVVAAGGEVRLSSEILRGVPRDVALEMSEDLSTDETIYKAKVV